MRKVMKSGAGEVDATHARSALAELLASFLPVDVRADPSRAPVDSRWLVFDCELRGGIPVPLKQSQREHPLMHEIADACIGRDRIGAAIALKAHLALVAGGMRGSPLRVMVLPDSGIAHRLEGIGLQEAISSAELHLLKQLLGGTDLAGAARSDGVSHETRRSQFKSLARKLAARSQGELVSRVLTQLLEDPASPSPSIGHWGDGLFIALCEEFLPDAHCHLLQGASGAFHPIIELGPPEGRPVILVHPQMLPDLRDEDMEALQVRAIRLVVPLRHGALAWPTGPLDVTTHLDHACEGIELARRHFCGDRAELLACISGCAYAIEYARRHAGHVSSIGFAGAPVFPVGFLLSAGRLRNGLLRLATGDGQLFARVMGIFSGRIERPETFRRLLLNYYRTCPADLAVIEAEYAAPHGGERARKLCAASMESIRHDLYHQVRPRWEQLPTGVFPAAFFHGQDDVNHPIAGVRTLSNELGGLPVHAIPEAGQLLYYRHFAPLLEAYNSFSGQVRKS